MTNLETLVEIEAIKQMRARFARCMDTKDWAGMRDTIAADCAFDAGPQSGVEEFWYGPEDVVANIRRNLATAVSVHHAHTPEIELTSNTTARGIWAMQDVLRWAGPPAVELIGYGHYNETYTREAGRWQLQSFKLTRLSVTIDNSAAQPPAGPPRPLHPTRTMQAVLLHEYGGPEQLRYETVAEPLPGAGEILVKVAAAAVNPVDSKARRGVLSLFMPMQFPARIGGDLAGVVEAVGAGVTAFKPGDRVMGMINPFAEGASGEKVAAPAAAFAKVPDQLDLIDAAALPTGVLTGLQLIEDGLQPKAADRVLVVGAAGSVGRAAVYAAAARGAQVIAGVRGRSRAAVADLPVAAVVDLDDPAAVAAAGPFDGIADTVGGRVAERLCEQLRPGAALASVAAPAPVPEDAAIPVIPVWVGFNAQRLEQFADAVAQGRYRVPIAHRLPLAQAQQAHTLLDAGGVNGKILLLP
jgi:NADPH:quinone reductase-like Zn-dependent oxidoreductase